MVEYTDDEAKNKFGDRLFVAGLAVVQEPGKIRVVHDGSNGIHVNHRVRPRDQLRSPGAGELRCILREKAVIGRKLFAIAGDISKAHRRVKVREADWGYQACRLRPGYIWVNCVGTYGMTPAAYYWGRAAAAAIVRLPHYLLGSDFGLELELYVDDFLFVLDSQAQIEAAGFLIFVFTALGIPFHWSKFRGGVEVEWIGYWMHLRDYKIGMSSRRAGWLSTWLRARVEDGVVDMGDFCSVLGRLCFSMGLLEFARPFLAPLYAWAAAVGHLGRRRLPWSVSFLMIFLAEQFSEERRAVVVHPVVRAVGEAFRADAKAEGSEVVVGGWECVAGTPASRARWFLVSPCRKSAPWAFAHGSRSGA